MLQAQRVIVHALRPARDGRAQRGQPLFEARATTEQDAHPRLRRRTAEERHMRLEGLVIPCLGTGPGNHFGEALLALGGEGVDDPAAPADAGAVALGGVLRDEAARDEVA